VHRLQACLQDSLDAPDLRVVAVDGERPAVDVAREPWIPVKYGAQGPNDWVGVVPVTARLERKPGAATEELKLIVKVSPREGLARTLIPWIVEREKIALDRPYWDYRSAAESDQTCAREQHLYALGEVTPALHDVLPRCYGRTTNVATDEHALFLHFETAQLLDASGATADWPEARIDAALQAAAGWHATFWGIKPEQASWAAPRLSTADMVADTPLWLALLEDARRRFPDIVSDTVFRRRKAFVETLGDWHPAKDALPSTLAHNDFNQRNIGFRPAPLVLDWELVKIDTACRDVVELLTFVLPANAARSQVDAHLQRYRHALMQHGVATGIDGDSFSEGFRCELKVEAINRIGLQGVFGAAFPLPYLARINANIERLLDMYG
jgi:hypothetical protein